MAQLLLNGVTNIGFDAFGRSTLEDHECEGTCRCTNRRCPSAIAKAPNPESTFSDVRIGRIRVVHGFHVVGAFRRTVLLPVATRFSGAALVVADDIEAIEYEIGNEKAHFT